jgi:hypothetical protein
MFKIVIEGDLFPFEPALDFEEKIDPDDVGMKHVVAGWYEMQAYAKPSTVANRDPNSTPYPRWIRAPVEAQRPGINGVKYSETILAIATARGDDDVADHDPESESDPGVSDEDDSLITLASSWRNSRSKKSR